MGKVARPKNASLKNIKRRKDAEPSTSTKLVKSSEPKLSSKYISADTLSWKPIKTSSFLGIDAGGGMMMLEELEDVGIEWDEQDDGRKIAKFVEIKRKNKQKENKKSKAELGVPDDNSIEEATKQEYLQDENVLEALDGISQASEDCPDFAGCEEENAATDKELHSEDKVETPFNDELLPEWSSIRLHPFLKKSFLALSFTSPTPIQNQSLPAALDGRDVVGVAETGSGKTLAYGLPMLNWLLKMPAPKDRMKRALSGLVLCPTRELALQVVDHLNVVLSRAFFSNEEEGESRKKSPPRISIGNIVGGLSQQKQKRILDRGCDILVATPGRLWDLIKADDNLARDLRRLRFLVIDEADRMIENGHFDELESIVRLTQRPISQQGPDDDDPVFQSLSTALEEAIPREDLQTFVFSATLSKDLQRNLKRRNKNHRGKGKKSSTLEDLVEKLDFRDENPEVIDLSPEGGVVKTLRESMIECTQADKDIYLYYFLLRYPGRTLIFVNSIDSIRRLAPLFNLLQTPLLPLHSHLQQKQRLKNLERFKKDRKSVMIATDVAARGLDIEEVDHVIHFNLPRSADAYIHRSGRTARAKNEGFALQIVSPDEKSTQRALMTSLDRRYEFPSLEVESGFLPALKKRLALATEIEKAQHRATKESHDKNWLLEAAEALDVAVDPKMLDNEADDPDAPFYKPKKTDRSKGKINVESLKRELKELLGEKLVARGVSLRYPTSGSKVIVDDLIKSTGHQALLGASTRKAYDEVQPGSKRKLGGSRPGIRKKQKANP
ncbi:hypothetical protein L204_102330 [Cryptococcus depauperatus]|nr:ATP-dependent RNA helicase MAK5 [Cryptococcus depauperatus CBS 7855]